MGPNIVVIDYHKGNLSSVERGLVAAGASAHISDDPAHIAMADAIVLPGVGSFEDAMDFMRTTGQAEAVVCAARGGTPFLGICLGMQLLFERGSERVRAVDPNGTWAEGMGVLEGSCTRLVSTRLKVPHVGWDQVDITSHGEVCPLLAGLPQGCNMYFTHSYAVDDDVDPSVVCSYTHYVRSFASAVWVNNVYGVQFHPEKSSGSGMRVLRNFVGIVTGKPAGWQPGGSS